MRLILLILTAILFIGCSQRARCIRAYERCGPLWRTDTFEFFDSILIERNTVDTVIDFQRLTYFDTITLRDGRAIIRVVRLPGDSIWVQGECADTVVRYVTQRVMVAGPKKKWPWWQVAAIAAVFFFVGWRLSRRVAL